jgi:hypothetical protein
MAKQADKQALKEWEDYRKALLTGTALETNKTGADIEKHRKYLEAHPVEWMRYMFPNYATSEFALFHVAYIKRIIEHDEWYEVNSWSRELAKDTVTMMVMFYLNLTGKKRFTLFVSSSYDAACDLLKPYMLNYEANQRIIAYYGEQKLFGAWESGDFTTRSGVRYVALGAGQSPRGKKNENLRPDSIICTDLDTDEDCRNKDVIDKRFDWLERALYMTRSISKPLLFLVLGNIIARDCCVTRAAKRADHHDIVNIRDKHGRSSWLAKNTEEMVDRVLSKMSTKAQQAECFNNPVSEGDIFKEETWGEIPPIHKFNFLIAYGDPSPSNNVSDRKNSTKALWLIGAMDGKFYVITGYLDRVINDEFVNWFYFIKDYVNSRTQIYNYIENNTLQDPFFEQVFMPLFYKKGQERGHHIGIIPDVRKKPDKFSRIEGNLDPLYRSGRLIFNIKEKNNPHMQKLIEQFKLFSPSMKAPADGPDAVEGAVFIANNKVLTITGQGESLISGFGKGRNNRL